jgi:predicted nucleotidyltransferase component of viral defense system
MEKIAEKYGKVSESHIKRFSLFIVPSYEDRAHNIKIEVNRRNFGSRYEIQTYLGISMQIMVIEDMFAHKLMAMYERIGKTSRDIYDVWFFLKSRFPINREIVEKRAEMPFDQLVKKFVDRLENMSNRHIPAGTGELLSPCQKDWAKVHLREETIALLKLRFLS